MAFGPAGTPSLVGVCGRGTSARRLVLCCRQPSAGEGCRGAGGCVGGVGQRRCATVSVSPKHGCIGDGVAALGSEERRAEERRVRRTHQEGLGVPNAGASSRLLKLSRRCSRPGDTGDDIDESCERPCGGIPPSAPPEASPQGVLCSCCTERCGDAGSKEGRRRGCGGFGSGVILSTAAAGCAAACWDVDDRCGVDGVGVPA